MPDLQAVRIDTDGTHTPLTVPHHAPTTFVRQQLDGWPEYAHYGTPESAICAIVHETGMIDGLPKNERATKFVGLVRGCLTDYWLHGPVIFVGYDPHADELVDLAADQLAMLDKLDEVLAAEAARNAYLAGMASAPKAGESRG